MRAAWLALLVGCGGGVEAIVDADRPQSWFDVPFPSNDLLDSAGRPDLSGFPEPDVELSRRVLGGWATRLEQVARGFGNNTPAYFRFQGVLDVPDTTLGAPDDPVLWVSLHDGELLPLDVRFLESPITDPYLAANTLVFGPTLGHPPRSGETYAAVVMRSAGARSPAGYVVPDGVYDALAAAGVSGRAAVATVFTVQDGTGQLRTLRDDVAPRLGNWGDVAFKRVSRVEITQGQTESGRDGTSFEVFYEGGGSEVTWLGAVDPPEDGTHSYDLLDDWPMAVFEARIPLLNYSGLDDKPYMEPGVAHVTDVDRLSGWIDVGPDGVADEPDVELVRITVSIPLDDEGTPISGAKLLMYDHGTGGHAYNGLLRRNVNDRMRDVQQAIADAGYAMVGRDAPMYGQRYPLIDEGYGTSLGFYNIVNLPAFRDNQRQAALEGYQVLRYVQDQLTDDLGVAIDATAPRRMGHSLGSVTTNLGLAMGPQDWDAAFLSGTGGVFSLYFLETGLLASIDSATVAGLFPLFGVQAPDEVTTRAALGAILGVPEDQWDRLDRFHPSLMLFQWTMDPSDPMAVARDEEVPIHVSIGRGDWQTPDFTAEALIEALPDVRDLLRCEPRGAYDPHHCTWREPEGPAFIADWLAE